MSNTYPEYFARFYDLIYHQMRDGMDHEFLMNEIKKTGGKVLEVGVGTGRLFADALKRGADIYGIDTSQPMIDVLAGKLTGEQAGRISMQNIINFQYDFQFDLILAPFRVIMHLTEKEYQMRALDNVYRYLKPGGRFVFDTFVPDLKQLISGLDNHVDFEGEYEPGKKLRRIVSTRPELMKQIINVTFRFEWDEAGGMKKETWTVPLRYFFRYELEHLVERSAFEEFEILGDYQGNILNEDSKEFIVICHKMAE